MKCLISFIVLFFGMLCNINAHNVDPMVMRVGEMAQKVKVFCSDDVSENNDCLLSQKNEIRSFVTIMYENKLYEDYGFLKRSCSPDLLKKLQDAYNYDTDSEAYATWLFRSGHQDSKPGSDGKTIMLDVKFDGEWCIYTALDMGWEFTNRIKISIKNGEIVIDDLCAAKD